jgi:hypothetical protein
MAAAHRLPPAALRPAAKLRDRRRNARGVPLRPYNAAA